MKKSFFRRHVFFFITLAILVLCECLIVKDCIRLYKIKMIRAESVTALKSTLDAKRQGLPHDHMEKERRAAINLREYRSFIDDTWPSIVKLPFVSNPNAESLNNVALFFSLSDYVSWAKEMCDAFGVGYDPSCTFGVQDLVERGQDIFANEVRNVQQQKEQLKLILSYLTESKDSYLKLLSIKREGNRQEAFFENNSLFLPEVNRFADGKSFMYQIKFSSFSGTFRKFLKNLYAAELPIIIRSIDVTPSPNVNFSKDRSQNLIECTPSVFSLVIEFLDIPQSYSQANKKGMAIQRKILYELSR